MANAPIQVILNTDGYRRDRDTKRPNSAGTDFFEGDNSAFAAHKQKLKQQLVLISEQIQDLERKRKYGSTTYIKVSMRPDALAKSHRPTTAIFKDDKAPEIGVDGLGELICEVDTNALQWVTSAIEKSEIDVRQKLNKVTGELQNAPTRYRCEVSAIGKIELWDKSDRRGFDVSTAIDWLSDPRSGHVYHVELFRPIISKNIFLTDALSQSLIRELQSLPSGILVYFPKNSLETTA